MKLFHQHRSMFRKSNQVIYVVRQRLNIILFYFPDGSIVSLDFTYDDNNNVLTIRKPGVNIANDFTIQLQ